LKPKLLSFTRFSDQLLPHEGHYIARVQAFQDEENQQIIHQLVAYATDPDVCISFDEQIDKRKYSRIKNWVKQKLDAIDVDLQYEWITKMEQQIMMDGITPQEENKLLRTIRNYEQPAYYFMKLYELAQHYQQFLLVRMRHKAHQEVHAFILKHRASYQRSKAIYEQLHQATVDITNQYSLSNTESNQWEDWLKEIFWDDSVDGLNRYYAFIRLTFMHLNYRQFDKLVEIFQEIERLFQQGLCYSKRIMLNYYSNRLILHSKIGELDKATYYGYLSIRQRNADFFHYVNNLCGVLLRRKKAGEALALMDRVKAEIKEISSSHTKVLYSALYIRCLIQNYQPEQAQKYAERFLRGYREEIFAQRWQTFFTSYFHALIVQEKYETLVKIAGLQKLFYKEKQARLSQGYSPVLAWYIELARFKEGRITEKQFLAGLRETMTDQTIDPLKWERLCLTLDEMMPCAPAIIQKFKEELSLTSTH